MSEQKNLPGNYSNDFRASRILHLAMLTGMVLFALASVVIIEFNTGAFLGPDKVKEYGIIFLAAAGIMAIICVMVAIVVYRKRTGEIKNIVNTLGDKLNQYRSALISYLALCEAPGLFAVIAFLLTGDYKVLGITALMAGAMLMKRPTPQRIIADLELDWKEQQELL